jgi:predicted nucleic acid-binding protein
LSASVLFDTSFLISLVDEKRKHHAVAAQYYRLALEQQAPMFLSVIVVSEFAIKQPITDLPLNQFRILPFNVPHAVRAAELWRQINRDDGDSRVAVRDDLKLLAQADQESIPIILTEDTNTLHKYCNRLREQGSLRIRTILLKDGFDPSGLREDGQRGLSFPTAKESPAPYSYDESN